MGTAGTYKTKQRELIWNYLEEHREVHTVADEIVEHLRQQGTSVGKSTVYRYLDKLVLEGRVRRFYVEEGMSACYQLADGKTCGEHFHLKCTRCGQLLHVQCETLSEISCHIYESHQFRLDNSKTVFYGVCATCAQADPKPGEENA